MNPPDRLPDRVAAERDEPPETRAAASFKGPESLSLAGVSPTGRSERISRLRRTGQVQLDLVRGDLSDREWNVLHSLQVHPYLTAKHLQTLHFSDHATVDTARRTARRVLKRMADRRLIEPLERRVGGIRAGSASFVWRLGPVGDRLLRALDGDGIRKRRKEPSSYYLDHRLAVADAYVALVEAERTKRFELVEVAAEPPCWRSYLGPHGGQEILKPDLFAVTADGEYEDAWFIEIDRGTESIPTLIRKCAQYEQYRRTGQEQRRRGVFPLVVWQLPNHARVTKLAAAIRAARRLDPSLYRLTTPNEFIAVITAPNNSTQQEGGEHA